MSGFKHMMEGIEFNMENHGELVHPQRWQSLDVSDLPQAQMVELLHRDLRATMESENPQDYQEVIKPNLPWADDHFLERVCGEPLNPGVEWANWPWANSANGHRGEDQQFNHNYMERYWPKYAGKTQDGRLLEGSSTDFFGGQQSKGGYLKEEYIPKKGIRHEYGDLGNVVELLTQEPDTRQAYLPIWFPEDTGTAHMGRKPCTLGYHFIVRNNKLDIVYYIRSCDFFRHFRDDVYLTVRLALWVIEQCRKANPTAWDGIIPGDFLMKITSLHMFIGDYQLKYGKNPGE